MKARTSFAFVVCACIGLMLVSCARERRTTTLPEQLRGWWQCVSLWEGGKEVDNVEARDTRLHFEDDTVAASSGGSAVTGTYLIVSDSNPVAIDITYTADGELMRVPAIIEITGTTMRMCHPAVEGRSRPLKLEATRDTV